jgi:hypothetical protein
MKCRVLGAAVLFATVVAGSASGGPVTAATFSGYLDSYIFRMPVVDTWNMVKYPMAVDSATIVNEGMAMVDLMGTTAHCYTDGGGPMWCGPSLQSQAIGVVNLTGGKTPTIDLMGSATNGQIRGQASITYFYRLDKSVSDAPDVSVPISLKGSTSLSVGATRPASSSAYAAAAASVLYRGPGDSAYKSLYDLSTYTTSGSSQRQGDFTVQETLAPGYMAQVYMRLVATAGDPVYGKVLDTHTEFQAILDPLVTIDPLFRVMYNGEEVPATELYSLSFSPEMTPSTTVPEHSSLFLTGATLLGLTRAARRRAVQRH